MLSGFYCSFPYASDAPFTFIVPPTPGGTRPDCGGILSSATASQRYASGHIQCGDLPPTPPVPPPAPSGGGIGGTGAQLRGRPIRLRPLTPYERLEMERQYDDGRRREKQFEELLDKLNDFDGEDQEDLMIMISAWMSIKN